MSVNRSPDYDDKTDEDPRGTPPADGRRPVLEPNEARQGVTHHNVRRVLGISLVLLVLAYLVVYFGYFG
jgi:hypothetical protein